MKLYELEPNTAKVAHPEDADVVVELIQPTLRDVLQFQERAAEFKTAAERFDGFTGFLAKHVKSVAGLVDKAGAQVYLEGPLDTIKLEPITRPAFDCQVERDVDVIGGDGKPTGQTERKVVREWFATYLVTKLMAEETFSRPLESGRTP